MKICQLNLRLLSCAQNLKKKKKLRCTLFGGYVQKYWLYTNCRSQVIKNKQQMLNYFTQTILENVKADQENTKPVVVSAIRFG